MIRSVYPCEGRDPDWAPAIAGVAWSDKAKPTYDKGATGWGVRLLDQFVADVGEG